MEILKRTAQDVVIFVLPLLVGCSLDLNISNLNSSIINEESALPSISIVPSVDSMPIGSQVKVQYCIPLSIKAIEATDQISFQIPSGTFSATSLNFSENCFEATLTANTTMGLTQIEVLSNGEKIEVSTPRSISFTSPQLNFTGNSDPTSPVANRIISNSSGDWSLTGVCDYLFGAVSIQGPALNGITTTDCKNDNTFSIQICVFRLIRPGISVRFRPAVGA